MLKLLSLLQHCCQRGKQNTSCKSENEFDWLELGISMSQIATLL